MAKSSQSGCQQRGPKFDHRIRLSPCPPRITPILMNARIGLVSALFVATGLIQPLILDQATSHTRRLNLPEAVNAAVFTNPKTYSP